MTTDKERGERFDRVFELMLKAKVVGRDENTLVTITPTFASCMGKELSKPSTTEEAVIVCLIAYMQPIGQEDLYEATNIALKLIEMGKEYVRFQDKMR